MPLTRENQHYYRHADSGRTCMVLELSFEWPRRHIDIDIDRHTSLSLSLSLSLSPSLLKIRVIGELGVIEYGQ